MHHTHCLHTLHFGGKFAKVFPSNTFVATQLKSVAYFEAVMHASVCVCVPACQSISVCVCVCVGGRQCVACFNSLLLVEPRLFLAVPGGCQTGSLSKLFCGQLAFILLEILSPCLPHIRPLNYPQHVCAITTTNS